MLGTGGGKGEDAAEEPLLARQSGCPHTLRLPLPCPPNTSQGTPQHPPTTPPQPGLPKHSPPHPTRGQNMLHGCSGTCVGTRRIPKPNPKTPKPNQRLALSLDVQNLKYSPCESPALSNTGQREARKALRNLMHICIICNSQPAAKATSALNA